MFTLLSIPYTLSAYCSSSNLSTALVLYVLVRYLITLQRNRRLPNGPLGLPLFGYLPFLGKNPHYKLFKLSEKYGSIYTLPMGKEHIVVLNDWDSVKDSLRKDSFLARPQNTSLSIVTGVKSLIDDSNLSWREDRKVFENIFRTSLDSTHIFKNLVHDMRYLLVHLRKTNAVSENIRELGTQYITKFFYSFIFGKHFFSSRPLFDTSIFYNISILSFYPSWLARLCYRILDIFNHYRFSLFVKLFRNETRSHYKQIRVEPANIRDLIDAYLIELMTRKSNMHYTTMSIEKLRANCQVFLSFGNEAFLSTIEWSLISVAAFQEHQHRINQEIQTVIGNRMVDFAYIHRMPFTSAFLNEILRWKTVIPFNFLRRATEDSTIIGLFIPKNTLILSNIWAVHHDPKVWESPYEFRPERFLSEDGSTFLEHEGFMPFSLGKRSCVAEPFVRKLLFIYFVSILQKFHVRAEERDQCDLFEEDFNIIIRPRGDIRLSFELRHRADAQPAEVPTSEAT